MVVRMFRALLGFLVNRACGLRRAAALPGGAYRDVTASLRCQNEALRRENAELREDVRQCEAAISFMANRRPRPATLSWTATVGYTLLAAAITLGMMLVYQRLREQDMRAAPAPRVIALDEISIIGIIPIEVIVEEEEKAPPPEFCASDLAPCVECLECSL